MRVVLRDFVARGLVGKQNAAADKRDALWQFIISELPETVRDFSRQLRTELLNVGGLLLLDGLDEVPEAETAERRDQVKALVGLLRGQFPQCRVLVTSRPYAYAGDWQLDGFGQVTTAAIRARGRVRRYMPAGE